MDGVPQLVPVLANHRFDEAALSRYLGEALGADGPMTVRQFQGGQSNPTFHLAIGAAEYVLRKQPPGVLLPSAHAVDREYQVLRALQGSEVPVPRVHVLCRDAAVIGTIFYIMEYLPGRVFIDRGLPECSPGERAAIYDDMNRVLAALHRIDWRAAGLTEFGRAEGYIPRQIARWSRQYQASRWENFPPMERLMEWLAARPPPAEEAAVVHGDYRLGNLLIHPTEPRIIGVLDWELATLGHPLADLAYNVMTTRLPASSGGIAETAMVAAGMPSEAEYVAAYCRQVGRPGVPDLELFIIVAMFRLAAIVAGVYRRALDGNAADPRAIERAATFRDLASRAWNLAQSQ